MKNHEERNTLLAVIAATVVTLGLGSLSALYLDRVLGGALRGTDWDFLLFPGVAILLTEGISNSAAVAILLPIGFSLGDMTGVNPVMVTFISRSRPS